MYNNKYLVCLMLVISTVVTSKVYAISIDSMLKFATDKHQSYFTITNNNESRMFLNTRISEIIVVNGELKKEPYTRNNIQDWYVGVRPSKTIIDSGFKKDFEIYSICNDCISDKDRIFQVSFLPTPYTSGEMEVEHSVNVAIGLGPYVILPGEEMPIDLAAEYIDNTIIFKNKGDSVIKLSLKAQCENEYSCSEEITILSGRVFKLDLPESMQTSSIDATAVTAFNKFKSEFSIQRGQ